MKCSQCGAEFEGNFCPECGAKAGVETPPPIQQQTNQNTYQQPPIPSMPGKIQKKKKPFYLRWWFILIVIVVIAGAAASIGSGGEKIKWSDMILGDMIPKPPVNKGKIYENSSTKLWVDINKISDKQYSDYVKSCKEKGFTIDAEENSFLYTAYNDEGYELNLSYYGNNKGMLITLETAMEMSSIQWPSSTVGKILPAPKSLEGKFSYEDDDSFFVYIGNTTKSDFDEYVNTCSNQGFNIDYNKNDTYYFAENADGYSISLKYAGNNVMTVEIHSPEKEEADTQTAESAEKTNTDNKPAENTDNSKNTNDSTGIRSDFKAAMDSYEEFMDGYAAFMKKYSANPSDTTLLADYAEYMSRYADVAKKFDEWKSEDMNDAELAYYIDVQARVSKKLLEVSQ